MSGSFYRRTSIISTIVHAVLILVLVMSALVQGCQYRKKKVELLEFSIAVETGEEAAEPAPVAPGDAGTTPTTETAADAASTTTQTETP